MWEKESDIKTWGQDCYSIDFDYWALQQSSPNKKAASSYAWGEGFWDSHSDYDLCKTS